MSPLNLFYYYRHNLGKVLPQLISVTLGVFLMYFACIIGGGLLEGIHNESIYRFEKSSVLYISQLNEEDEKKLVAELKGNENIQGVLSCGWGYAAENVIIQQSGSGIFYATLNNINTLMKAYNNKIVEGRLPKNENEALVNEKTIHSMNVKMGDWIGSEVDDRFELDGKLKIVGIYRGRSSYVYSYSEKAPVHPIMVAIAKPGRLKQMNDFISKLGIDFEDLNVAQSSIDSLFQIVKLFGCFILIIMMFVITLMVSNLNYIYFYSRSSEFALFQCLGQSKKSVVCRIFKEMAVISTAGFFIGILLSFAGGMLFNMLYAIPKGTPVSTFNWWYVLYAVFIPISVGLFSLGPVFKMMRRTDFIEVIEGKG